MGQTLRKKLYEKKQRSKKHDKIKPATSGPSIRMQEYEKMSTTLKKTTMPSSHQPLEKVKSIPNIEPSKPTVESSAQIIVKDLESNNPCNKFNLDFDDISSITCPSVLGREYVVKRVSSVEQTTTLTEESMLRTYMEYRDSIRSDFVLTSEVLRNIATILDEVSMNSVNIGYMFLMGSRQIDIKHEARFNEAQKQDGTSAYVTGRTKLLCHFHDISTIHKIIVEYCEHEDFAVFDLLKQIALSHALMNVKPEDFKNLDVLIISFYIQQGIIHDEGIKFTIAYLHTITNYIIGYLESFCGCTDSGITDREGSVVRENYRLMKAWNEFTAKMREETKPIFLLLNELNVATGSEKSTEEIDDNVTIDTETLKRRDCIMKHFVEYKR